jgi:hypothetical protein
LTQLTTILNVTQKGVDAKQAILTIRREPKVYSALNKGVKTGSGRSRKRT